jgi:hypothetical protein
MTYPSTTLGMTKGGFVAWDDKGVNDIVWDDNKIKQNNPSTTLRRTMN